MQPEDSSNIVSVYCTSLLTQQPTDHCIATTERGAAVTQTCQSLVSPYMTLEITLMSVKKHILVYIVVVISCRLRIQVFQYTSPDILISTDTSASSSVTLMLLIRGCTMHILVHWFPCDQQSSTMHWIFSVVPVHGPFCVSSAETDEQQYALQQLEKF